MLIEEIHTLMDLMPSPSSMRWMGSSSASTTARFSSNMRKFILSHFDDNHRGWSAGQVGVGASTSFQPGKMDNAEEGVSVIIHTR